MTTTEETSSERLAHESVPLVWLDPASLAESKTNPRKMFHGIEELAEDLKVHGVLEPLLARPTAGGGHELVFGARRLRAALKAKLPKVPVMVRTISDERVLEIQIVENSQRSDIHPLEEAEGYERLQSKYGRSVVEIADRVGKTRAHVYARMKLLALSPEGRKAFYDGTLSPSTALILARVSPPHVQKEALIALKQGNRDGDPMGARQALELVTRRFMLRLAGAPFDRGDKDLVPKAGACSTCPKRTGNQPELFADVKSKDLCTDPGCWDEKLKAGVLAKAETLKSKGVKVVEAAVDRRGYGGPRYVPPAGYARVDDNYHPSVGNVQRAMRAAKAPPKPVVMFDGAAKPVELVALRELPKKPPMTSSEASKISKSSWEKAQRERRKKGKALETVIAAAVGILPKLSADELWRFVGEDYVSRANRHGRDMKVLDKLKGPKLAFKVAELALRSDFSDPHEAGSRLGRLLARAEIDWRAIYDKAMGKKPEKAKPAAKGKAKAKGGKK